MLTPPLNEQKILLNSSLIEVHKQLGVEQAVGRGKTDKGVIDRL